MATDYKWFPIADFRGGRNGADDPLSLDDNQVVQMRNGETWRTRLFRKRNGAAAPSIGSVFSGVISSLIAHFPSNNPAAAELWAVDDAATPNIGRMAAATTFSAPTMKDNIASGGGPFVRGVSYNGKLFLFFDSAVDRGHVYDPNLSAPAVRRAGLDTPAAPSVANTGSGSYAATLRYYRVRYRIKHGSIVDAQSEPSASTSFTPSGSGTHARVTKPASISESETHWVLEGSDDDVTFYEIAETAVGTTTYDDNETPAEYNDGTNISPVLGSYTKPKSHKYGIAAFNRMLMIGGWESGALQSRLHFTAAKGASDKADDERVPDTLKLRNTLDLGEGVGGDATGFAGPLYDGVFVFKYERILKLIPTGASSPVFDVVEISTTKGAIEQEAIAVGEDAKGRPTIYFLDAQVGPMMVGGVPPTEIGQGVRDLWDSVNLAATKRAGWVLDYPAKKEVLFAWATGSNNEPNILAVYNKQTGGWSVRDTGGKIRLSRCAALFARTFGASMSRDKVPYVGYASDNNKLLRLDTSDTADDSTTFQAIVKTRPISRNNGQPFRSSCPVLVCKPASGVTLTVNAYLDFGEAGTKLRTGTVDLTLTADESSASASRVIRRVSAIDLSGALFVQLEIGDAEAVSNAWTLEQIYIGLMDEVAGP